MDPLKWMSTSQPLSEGEFTYLRNEEGLGTRLGLGWRDGNIVAIDTVVRYRTFTSSGRPCAARAHDRSHRPW